MAKRQETDHLQRNDITNETSQQQMAARRQWNNTCQSKISHSENFSFKKRNTINIF